MRQGLDAPGIGCARDWMRRGRAQKNKKVNTKIKKYLYHLLFIYLKKL
jgi:hypothetical protein